MKDFYIIQKEDVSNYLEKFENYIKKDWVDVAWILWLDNSDEHGFWDGVVVRLDAKKNAILHYFTTQQTEYGKFSVNTEVFGLGSVCAWDGSDFKKQQAVQVALEALDKRQW